MVKDKYMYLILNEIPKTAYLSYSFIINMNDL